MQEKEKRRTPHILNLINADLLSAIRNVRLVDNARLLDMFVEVTSVI